MAMPSRPKAKQMELHMNRADGLRLACSILQKPNKTVSRYIPRALLLRVVVPKDRSAFSTSRPSFIKYEA